ncbi:MAG: amidohydrolase family protein [Gemmatimonadota bacterium]|nr:amidohydrolase family protein [Gemmatimonadota bacterium]
MTERPGRAWQTSYRASLVMPMGAESIVDGAVLVEGDRIAWVGPRAAHPAAPQARIVELGDAVLAPGLVNAHTHLDLTVLRGLLDGLSFFDWIRGIIALRAVLSPDETLDSAHLGAIEALESGITTVADTAPTLASFDAMLELGLRGIAYLEVFGPDPAQCDGALAELASRVASARAQATPRVQVGVSPHAPYSVSDALFLATARFARDNGLRLATHVAESRAESDLVAQGSGPFATMLAGRGIDASPRARTPVALLEHLGVLGLMGEDALLVHCVQCDDSDVRAIADARASVATCPHSNRYFGHGVAPIAHFVRAGVSVGVGSDSLASNDVMDLLREARTAADIPGDATPFPVWLRATLMGANALRLADRIGTLQVGKQADLCAFPIPPGTTDTKHVRVGPKAVLTVVAGVERVCAGQFLGDAAGIRERNAVVAERLREWRQRVTLT